MLLPCKLNDFFKCNLFDSFETVQHTNKRFQRYFHANQLKHIINRYHDCDELEERERERDRENNIIKS